MTYFFFSDHIVNQRGFISDKLSYALYGIPHGRFDADFNLPEAAEDIHHDLIVIEHITNSNAHRVASVLDDFSMATDFILVGYSMPDEQERRLTHQDNVYDLDNEFSAIDGVLRDIKEKHSKAPAVETDSDTLFSFFRRKHNLTLTPDQLEEIIDEVMTRMEARTITQNYGDIIAMQLETAMLYITDLYSASKPEIFEGIGRAKHMIEGIIDNLKKE